MKWAPRATKSILQEYPNQIFVSSYSRHAGLALAFDSVLNSWNENLSASKTARCTTSDTSRFVSVLCLRSKYAGEITGLLSILDDEAKKNIANRLVEEIWNACKHSSNEEYKGALWRATAYLILCTEADRKLVHAIASSQIELFTSDVVETAIECWQWLLTARIDLELSFMREMVMAWQITFEKQIGLFSSELSITNPLAFYEGCNAIPLKIAVEPHIIWLNFLSEMVDTAKYSNRDKVEMFCILLHRCLPLQKNITQNRNVVTVGCRFKLLQCGLSLLQGNTIPKSLSKNILRERIYHHALDYFCSNQMCPQQNQSQLFEDIQILMKFWQTMRSEKKHLVTTELSDYDVNPNTLTVTKQSADAISITGSEVTRSGSGMTSGWYNTIPHSTSTLSKKSTNRNKRSHYMKDIYDKDYMKKRNLILELLAAELEFLITWYNPMASPDLHIPGEEAIMEWRARPIKLNLWRDYTRLAWNCNPALAVFLPNRYVIIIITKTSLRLI